MRAKRRATPRPSRIVRLKSPGLLVSTASVAARERVEGLRDAGVEPRRVEEPLRVALEVDGQHRRRRRGRAPAWRRLRSTRSARALADEGRGSPRAGSPACPGATRREGRVRRRPRCRGRSRRACRRGRRRASRATGLPGPDVAEGLQPLARRRRRAPGACGPGAGRARRARRARSARGGGEEVEAAVGSRSRTRCRAAGRGTPRGGTSPRPPRRPPAAAAGRRACPRA